MSRNGKTYLTLGYLCLPESVYLGQNVYELEQTLLKQRFHMTHQIFAISENEIHRRYSCNSGCTTNCRIFHQKHDWFKSKSEEFLEMFDQIGNESEVENHIKTIQNDYQCDMSFTGRIDLTAHEQTKPIAEYKKCDSTDNCAEELKNAI